MNHLFESMVRQLMSICVCGMAMVPLFGQEAKVGYVRFVNAVGVEGRMMLSIDGENANDKGYGPGEFTGGVGLSVGDYQCTFDHPVLEKLERTIRVVEGVSTTYIAYVKPEVDEQGEVTGRRLELYEFEPQEKGGASVTIVSLCERLEQLPLQFMAEGAGAPLDLNVSPLKPQKVTLKRSGGFALAYDKKVIASMTMAGPGHYAAAVYESKDDRGETVIKACMFFNQRFSGGN